MEFPSDSDIYHEAPGRLPATVSEADEQAPELGRPVEEGQASAPSAETLRGSGSLEAQQSELPDDDEVPMALGVTGSVSSTAHDVASHLTSPGHIQSVDRADAAPVNTAGGEVATPTGGGDDLDTKRDEAHSQTSGKEDKREPQPEVAAASRASHAARPEILGAAALDLAGDAPGSQPPAASFSAATNITTTALTPLPGYPEAGGAELPDIPAKPMASTGPAEGEQQRGVTTESPTPEPATAGTADRQVVVTTGEHDDVVRVDEEQTQASATDGVTKRTAASGEDITAEAAITNGMQETAEEHLSIPKAAARAREVRLAQARTSVETGIDGVRSFLEEFSRYVDIIRQAYLRTLNFDEGVKKHYWDKTLARSQELFTGELTPDVVIRNVSTLHWMSDAAATSDVRGFRGKTGKALGQYLRAAQYCADASNRPDYGDLTGAGARDIVTKQRQVAVDLMRTFGKNIKGIQASYQANRDLTGRAAMSEWNRMTSDYHRLNEQQLRQNDIVTSVSTLQWMKDAAVASGLREFGDKTTVEDLERYLLAARYCAEHPQDVSYWDELAALGAEPKPRSNGSSETDEEQD